ncbi:hypothetical protein DRQ53_12830 [bacterium]|nr:MAG: hypothetical protein DRQ53_12830 [bacterium]
MGRPVANDSRSDAALLLAFRHGDREAFAALYDRHASSVLAFALRFCSDRDLAEDVVQDCFKDLIDRIDDFELSGRLSSWFYTVARRRALRLCERSARNQGDPDDLLQIPDDGPADTADLRRLLARLPGPQQEVLLLRFLDGFDLESISDALEIPLGTVKSRLHNALAALRDDPACRRYFGREKD